MLLRKYRAHRAKLAIALSALTIAQLSLLLTSKQTLPAYAQALTDEDIASYARAVIDIEATRIAAYSEASDILTAANSELSILDIPLGCVRNRLSDMPDIPKADRTELRTVLVNFCNEASQLAEESNLTPQRFNSITEMHREDPEVAARIQAAIGDL